MTPDLDAVREPFKDPAHLANTADVMGRACKGWQASTAKYHFACRDMIRALIAEVEANRATIAGLTAMIDACTPYLKEGETPAERIVREVKDCIMLMGMLAQDRKERDAGRATIAGLRAALNAADDALTEAEAILGGEYGDHYGPLCEIMLKLRAEIALLKGEKDGK